MATTTKATITNTVPATQTRELDRQLSYLDGTSLVVGTIIGSGIFASPGSVIHHAGSGGASLIIWVFSGLIAYLGSLCYAELALSIPSAGGEVTYLKRAYNDIISFTYMWANVFITRPASFGIITLIFGEYLCRFVTPFARPEQGLDECSHSVWTQVFAFICALVVSFLNIWSLRRAAVVLSFSTGIKVVALVGLTSIGLAYFFAALIGSPLNGRTEDQIMLSISFINTSSTIYDYPAAFMSALWAYDGWNGLSYAIEELNESKDLVPILSLSIPLVTLLYAAANSAYIISLPYEIVSSSETVAVDLLLSIFGEFGEILMTLFVCISTFGAAIGSLYASSRLVFSAARDGQLPSRLSVLHSTTKTPLWAILSQFILTCFYLIIGDFEQLVIIFGTSTLFFYFITVFGMLRLRYSEPNLRRPYITSSINAWIFCTVTLFLVIVELFANPLSTLVSIAFISIGIPIQLYRQYLQKKKITGFRSLTEYEEVEQNDPEDNDVQKVSEESHLAEATIDEERKIRERIMRRRSYSDEEGTIAIV